MGHEGDQSPAVRANADVPVLVAQAQGDGEQPHQNALQKAGGWFGHAVKKGLGEAKKLGTEVGDQLQQIDGQQIGDAAKKAINSPVGKQIIGGVTGQEVPGGNGIIGTASKFLFPQGQIIGAGTREIGGFASRKYAKQLLDNPADMALKLDGNFDIFDANKNKFIHNDELQDSGGALSLLDSSRGLGPILQRGYSSIANLDGKDAELGIGRGDVDMLKLLTNPALRDKAIDDGVSSSRMTWGSVGLFAGLAGTAGAKYFAPSLLKQVGGAKVGLAVAALTAISSYVGGAIKHHSLSADFAEKEAQLKSTFESIKAAL